MEKKDVCEDNDESVAIHKNGVTLPITCFKGCTHYPLSHNEQSSKDELEAAKLETSSSGYKSEELGDNTDEESDDFLQSFDKEVGNSSYDTDEDTSDEENDDDDEWLFELYKTKKEEAIKAMEAEKEKLRESIKSRQLPVPPKHLPLDDEEKYTQVFQDYFADGICLKKEITTELRKEVEDVRIGFSTKKQEGYWPVIMVSPDEKTCESIKKLKEEEITLHKQLASKLKIILTRLYFGIEWSEEELQNTIEVVIKYQLQPVKLCSAGKNIVTKYTSIQQDQQEFNHTKKGTVTCNVHHQLNVGRDTYRTHYKVTPLHVVIPANNPTFRSALLSSSIHNAAKHRCIDHSPDDGITLVCDGYFIPTSLRQSIFPSCAEEAFDEMKRTAHYRSSTHGNNNVEFLLGKAGFVENYSDREYKYVLVRDSATGVNKRIPFAFYEHPCNVDIAVLKSDDDPQHNCSFHEQFSHFFPDSKWLDLPEAIQLKDMKFPVVFIKNNTVRPLAKQLKIPSDGRKDILQELPYFPTHTWEPSNTVEPGDSGSPVFLQNGNSFYFIGILMSKEHASPIEFSLKLVEKELTIHHAQQVIKEMEREMSRLKQWGEWAESKAVKKKITCLKKYIKIIKWDIKDQSLLPVQPYKISDLLQEPINGTVRSKLSICLVHHN